MGLSWISLLIGGPSKFCRTEKVGPVGPLVRNNSKTLQKTIFWTLGLGQIIRNLESVHIKVLCNRWGATRSDRRGPSMTLQTCKSLRFHHSDMGTKLASTSWSLHFPGLGFRFRHFSINHQITRWQWWWPESGMRHMPWDQHVVHRDSNEVIKGKFLFKEYPCSY